MQFPWWTTPPVIYPSLILQIRVTSHYPLPLFLYASRLGSLQYWAVLRTYLWQSPAQFLRFITMILKNSKNQFWYIITVLKTLEKIKITWFFITLYNHLVLPWTETNGYQQNEIPIHPWSSHCVLPLGTLSFNGGPFFTPAAFTCCWSSTLSPLGFGSCLMKEWGPKLITLRRKSQECKWVLQKLLFNILFTKDIKTQVLIHFGYITKLSFLIENFIKLK